MIMLHIEKWLCYAENFEMKMEYISFKSLVQCNFQMPNKRRKIVEINILFVESFFFFSLFLSYLFHEDAKEMRK